MPAIADQGGGRTIWTSRSALDRPQWPMWPALKASVSAGPGGSRSRGNHARPPPVRDRLLVGERQGDEAPRLTEGFVHEVALYAVVDRVEEAHIAACGVRPNDLSYWDSGFRRTGVREVHDRRRRDLIPLEHHWEQARRTWAAVVCGSRGANRWVADQTGLALHVLPARLEHICIHQRWGRLRLVEMCLRDGRSGREEGFRQPYME